MADTESRLKALEDGVIRISRDVRQLGELLKNAAPSEADPATPDGWWWHCPDCRAKLGYWLPKISLLRIVRGDLKMAVGMARDPAVDVTCSRCQRECRFEAPQG